MKKISFIINGTLHGQNGLKRRIQDMFGKEYLVELHQTQKQNHASELAKSCIESGCDYLIAVGGDGTMNEVVNGVMNTSEDLRKLVRVGLLPKGTGNDFSRSIGMKKSMNYLFELVKNEQCKPIDVGQISYISHDGELKWRFFNNIADIGIGGMVVEKVNRSQKLLGANLTFIRSVLQSFFTYKNKHVSLKNAHFEWEGRVISLCMANGKFFGSGLGIAPAAKVDDGKFELVIIGNVTVLEYLKYLPRLKRCKKIIHPEIQYHQVTSCKFDSVDKDCPIDMDGEFVGYPPIDLLMHPQAINFLRQ